ncbi:MAG: Amino-acid acetyltransferase [Turneriella sp.]|nr:Amino-acid acetyltransferase [Turneriella sp.]
MIRDAKIDDAEQIYNLLEPYVQKKILLRRSREEIRAHIDYTLVYTDDEKIIGTVSLVFFSESLCEIRALVIAENVQRGGIGRALVYAAEEKAKQLQPNRPLQIFALTYTPEFFERIGYSLTTKDRFPEKIYEVCQFCLRKNDCHEIAVEKIFM